MDGRDFDSDTRREVLSIARASPRAVLHRDRRGWLELFTPDARIEDPVGGPVYADAARRAAFWDTFIAPQAKIELRAERDFIRRDTVIRQVAIETTTAISTAPLTVPAIVEYRLSGSQITALRAFWRPRTATAWFGRNGWPGLRELGRQNIRFARRFGLRALLDFAQALQPAVSSSTAKTWMGTLVHGSLEEWDGLLRSAALEMNTLGPPVDCPTAWQFARRENSALAVERIICGGTEVAAILVGRARSAAIVLDTARGQRITRMRWLWSARTP